MSHQSSLLTFLLLAASLHAESPSVALAPAFANLETPLPIVLLTPPDGTQRLFLAQQRGQVRILPTDESKGSAAMFLDLASRKMEGDKTSGFEEGLIGMAFHPKYRENRKFYLCYTQQAPRRLVLSEMQASEKNPDQADLSTERILLEHQLPYWNHHGGNLTFGPDGMLYLGIGDGGGKGGDPTRLAQNTFSLNGKILRLDVDTRSGARAYGIPDDNPFVKKDGYREEIYALGIRNPWGMAFDAEGTMWIADVGQELFEEINLLEKGGNYGWSFREGHGAFPGRADAASADPKFVEPIHVYSRDQGISITGGLVYRGSKIPALQGAYVYADWGSSRLWALRYDKTAKKVLSNDLLLQAADASKGPVSKPAGIYEDANKEILLLDWQGKIARLMPRI
jgi:quinoprotein glucose dehydrogenase